MIDLGPTALTVFTGPMFSGKSGRLIATAETFSYTDRRIVAAKPERDTRQNSIATRRVRDGGIIEVAQTIESRQIATEQDFLNLTAGDAYDILMIDEVQFFPLDEPMQDCLGWFGRGIRELLHRRRDSSLQIFLSGLDTDSNDMPFGPIGGLLAIADHFEKLSGVCMKCKALGATKSQRTDGNSASVHIGDIQTFEVRCRKCFTPI